MGIGYPEINFMIAVDTNVLIYRIDWSEPVKQAKAKNAFTTACRCAQSPPSYRGRSCASWFATCDTGEIRTS